MADSIDVDINVNMNNVDEVDELTSKLQSATDEVEKLQDALDEAHLNGDDIEADRIADQLADATAEAENLQEKLDDIKDEEINVPVNTDDSDVDETKEKIEETSSTASSLGLALSGVVASAGIEQMAEKADSVNTSWNQLKLTFGGTATSMDALKSKTTAVGEATGRAGSTIRGYFNDMGIAGVKNTNLLADSFQALSGRSYQTGNSIESMEQKMKMMVMSGNAGSRQLTALGISSADLARVMGVSADEVSEAFKNMTPEERLQAITKAMGDGKQANEMYKQSFAGLKEQMSIAINGLMVAIGQGVLPTVIPVVQGVTGAVKTLAGAFRALPGPVQGVLGGLGGFLAVGATAVGTLGAMGKVGSGVVDGLRSIKGGYDAVKGAVGTAKTAIDAMRNAESITSGIRAALAVVTGTEAAAETAGATAKTAATGPTMGLAIAENSLLLPILLVTAAIIAIIAVLWYLYNTNESVRNAIDWLKAAFVNAGQIMYTSIVSAIEWITQALQSLWDYVMTVGGLFPAQASLTGNGIIDAILKVLMFLASLPLQLGMIFVNMIAQALGFGNNFSQRMIQAAAKAIPGFLARIAQLPALMYARLMMAYAIVHNWGMGLLQRGIAAANGFVNGVRSAISKVVGAISSALSGVVSAITRPFEQAYAKVKPIIDAIKSGISTVTGFFGASYYGVDFGGEGLSSDSTLNNTLSAGVTNNSNTRNANINNNFYGLVEESAAEYIINTVNERLRKENMVRGV